MDSQRPSRREIVLLAVVLAVGIALRGYALSKSAVEHFDEGVYASNIYFGPPDYAYPLQKFYAPPLLPALIEAGMIAGLAPNLAALLPSFLAGCGTIVAVWWFGRSWFTPAAGLAAATLVSLSNFHILYSTAALTDALLGLWLILAIDAASRSLFHEDYRWAVGAGVYTGLAWWTKYNGWLPLAIEAAALPLMWLAIRPDRKQLLGWLACLATTMVVAVIVWSPYYLSLQSQGGYAPIAENHAKYVVGFAGWINSLSRQAANYLVVESALNKLAIPLGVAAAVLAAVSGFANNRRIIGLSLLAAWFGGLFFATPMYTPYPRLLLPLLIAVWLSAGLAADWLMRPQRLRVTLLILISAAGIAVAFAKPQLGSITFAADRREVQRIADEIHGNNLDKPQRVIYVYGEPAMYFQLRAAGEELAAPVATIPASAVSVNGSAAPTYLLAGPHSQNDREFRERLANSPSWRLVKRHDYQPSALVWLDLHDARSSSRAIAEEPRHAFELYEFVP